MKIIFACAVVGRTICNCARRDMFGTSANQFRIDFVTVGNPRAGIGLLLALVLVPGLAAAANVADFIDFSLRNASNQVVLPGRLYVPPEASNTAVPRPFILFLHGGRGRWHK